MPTDVLKLGFLLFLFWADLVISLTTHGSGFILFPGRRTWNEVQNICVTSGLNMVRIDSSKEMAALQTILKKWIDEDLLKDDVWMGLYDKEARDMSLTVYQWQDDCSPLGNYHPWDSVGPEPNKQETDMCIRITLTGTFKTKNCSSKHSTVCQKSKVECMFEKRQEKRLSETGITRDNSIHNVSSCLETCKTKEYTKNVECVAVNIKETTGICRILTKSLVYTEPNEPSMVDQAGVDVYIKRCYTGSVSRAISVPANNDYIPVVKCRQPTKTSSTTDVFGTTTATTTMPTTFSAFSSISFTIVPSASTTPVGYTSPTFAGHVTLSSPSAVVLASAVSAVTDASTSNTSPSNAYTSTSTVTFPTSTLPTSAVVLASAVSAVTDTSTSYTSPSNVYTSTSTVTFPTSTLPTSAIPTATIRSTKTFITSIETSMVPTSTTIPISTLHTPSIHTISSVTSQRSVDKLWVSTSQRVSLMETASASILSAVVTDASTDTNPAPKISSTLDTTPAAAAAVSPFPDPNISCNFTGLERVCACEKVRVNPTLQSAFDRLLMDRKIISSYRRSKTSAPDYRPSAVSIGVTGILVMVVVASSLVIADFEKLWKILLEVRETVRKSP